MIEKIISKHFGLEVLRYQQLAEGAGSSTYLVETDQGKYILKKPDKNGMNNPFIEPKLCAFLLYNGIPVTEFVKNQAGSYLTSEGDELFHLQKFMEGFIHPFNQASPWLMKTSAEVLGKIHKVLCNFEQLPVGIGQNFFKNMTPRSTLPTYLETIALAQQRGDHKIEEDLKFRIELIQRFDISPVDFDALTCGNSHGDYLISQMICEEDKINAIIDWTSACRHPFVWEIMRSFVYAEPSCANGEIDFQLLISYIQSYLEFFPLTGNDLWNMPRVFFYQIAVCDYYRQYYYSSSENRDLFLHQAHFSTQLMRWFDKNLEELCSHLAKI